MTGRAADEPGGQATAAELAGRSFLYGFAGVAGKAAALLTVPFLARELGPGDYGLADLATSTAALLTLIVSFAGDIPAARGAGLAPNAMERNLWLRMYVVTTGVVSAVVVALLIPLSGVIAGELWSTPEGSGLAFAALLLVPLSALQASMANVPRLLGKGRQYAAVSLIDLMAQLVLAVLFVALGMGAGGVVAGFIVGSLIGLASSWWPARHVLTGSIERQVGMQMIRDGTRYLPALALPVVADLLTRVVLAAHLSTAEVGHFGLAIRLASAMSLLAGAFTSAYGPELLAQTHSSRSVATFRRVFIAYTTVLVAAASMVSLWAPQLVAIVAGESFADASIILPWLAAAGAATGSYALLMLAAGVGGRSAAVAWTAALGSATQVALVLALVGLMGAVASGIAVLAGQMVAITLLHRAIAARVPGVGISISALYAGLAVATLAALLNAADAQPLPRAILTLFVGGVSFVILRKAMRRPIASG